MKGTLEIKGIAVRAHHGCYEEERKNGGDFTVDVSLTMDMSEAAVSDSLEDTLDVNVVNAIVLREMNVPSCLMENVAYRIKSAILADCPEVEACTVRVAKLNPPLADGPAEQTAVIL